MSSNGSDRSKAGPPAKSEPGVLASLPSTRPQRPTTRRAAARRAAKARAERPANGTTAAHAGQGAARRTAQSGSTVKRLVPVESPAPPQGFDTEGAIEPGVAVQPPSGGELATSMVELLGELAQSGLSTGGRLLKSALARLPGL